MPGRRNNFFIAVLLLLSFIYEHSKVHADSCSSFTTCDSCTTSSSLCHWCVGGTCHAMGSPYGCVYGTYCYDNDKCQRDRPEFKGFAKPSVGVIFIVALVGGAFFICATSIVFLARDFAKQNEAEEEYDDMYYALSDDSDEEYFQISRVTSFPANGRPREELRVSGISIEQRPILQRGQLRIAHMTPWRGQGLRQRFARRLYLCISLFCVACVIVVLALGTLVLFFAPHVPVVNVCNTKFDWGSIVTSMKKAQVEADFQILASVYNPNYMDVVVESGVAVLRHKHIEVGQMVFEPFVSSGGYTTDILLIVEIDAEVWSDLQLGYEYETSKLAFFLDATITASISFYNYKTFPFTFSMNNYYIKVSDVTETDRSLCNCTMNAS